MCNTHSSKTSSYQIRLYGVPHTLHFTNCNSFFNQMLIVSVAYEWNIESDTQNIQNWDFQNHLLYNLCIISHYSFISFILTDWSSNKEVYLYFYMWNLPSIQFSYIWEREACLALLLIHLTWKLSVERTPSQFSSLQKGFPSGKDSKCGLSKKERCARKAVSICRKKLFSYQL